MMHAQESVHAASHKPDRGQMNGASAPRSAEEAGAAESPTKVRQYPPRAFLDEVAALYQRWLPRDWARQPEEESAAANTALYLLAVLDMMIRALGSPLAKFVEDEADKLHETALAISRGKMDPPGATRVAASPTPGPAPRPARSVLRALGIEHEHDGSTLHAANPVELLAWSYAGDPIADPIDGMLDSIKDDLSILQSAIAGEQELDEATLQMQLYRLQSRTEAAHLLYQRVMTHVDRLLAEKPEAPHSSGTTDAQQGATPPPPPAPASASASATSQRRAPLGLTKDGDTRSSTLHRDDLIDVITKGLCSGSDDPVAGILYTVASDIEVVNLAVARALESGDHPDLTFDLTLTGLGDRVRVALELHLRMVEERREHAAESSDGSAAPGGKGKR
ncbi:hypothetical protein WMF20_35525 [Sorangium sp. So ce834]|uniref:hypothetical protein n=1 Tax=Sorangium sp. So ce834 TaxID=3133321 RepID=UPI003F63C27E